MVDKNSDRRGFFNKIAKLGLASGIGALLLGRLGDKTLIPSVHAADIVIDGNNTGHGTTKLTSNGDDSTFQGISTRTSGDTEGIYGESHSPDGEAIQGYNTATTGDWAVGVEGDTASTGGRGVYGHAEANQEPIMGCTGYRTRRAGEAFTDWHPQPAEILKAYMVSRGRQVGKVFRERTPQPAG